MFNEWPSLAPQLALAQRIYGAQGAGRVADWLALQLARCDDPAFARLFSDHISLPGVTSGDFGHRVVRFQGRRLLGGIRFYARDVSRPFVEVMAHDFEDRQGLIDCVAAEWQLFAPTALRVLVGPTAPRAAGDQLDQAVCLAFGREMTAPRGRVTLQPFADVGQAVSMVAARYAEVVRSDPDLGRVLAPSSAEALRDWQGEGVLQAITVAGQPVGVFVVRADAVAWIEGPLVMEEVVATCWAGQGLAAEAQAVWGADHPDQLLIGTINGRNVASLRSARKAGRLPVLQYVFVPLR